MGYNNNQFEDKSTKYKRMLYTLEASYRSEGLPPDMFVEALISNIIEKHQRKHNINDDEFKFSYNRLKEVIGGLSRGTKLKGKFADLLDKLSDEELQELSLEANKNTRFFGKRFADTNSEELSQLVIRLLKPASGFMYEDIGCGSGNFLLTLCKYLQEHNMEPKSIHGIDINPKNVMVAKTLLSINYPAYYNEIKVGDVLKGDLEKHVPFQKAFVFPPFALKIKDLDGHPKSKMFDFAFTNRNSGEIQFIDVMLSRLQGNHLRAVALVPNKVLFNEDDKKYIELLIKNKWLEGIIELPAGTLNFSGVKTSLLVFSENNTGVKFVDTSDIKFSGNFINYILPYEKILDKYNKAKEINSKELKDVVNYAPSSYLISKKVVKDGTKLNSVSEVITGCKFTISHFNDDLSNKPTPYRILTSSNIQNDSIDWNSLKYINHFDEKMEKYIIHKNDIVITSKSSKAKVAIVDYEPKEKVIVTGGMLIVRPNTKLVSPLFLFIFLNSPKGQNALRMIQKGSFIVSMTANDLGQIIVPKVSLARQKDLASKYEYKWETYLSLKKELDRAKEKVDNFFEIEVEGE